MSITASVASRKVMPIKHSYPKFSMTSKVTGIDNPLILISVSTDATTGIGDESADNKFLFSVRLTGSGAVDFFPLCMILRYRGPDIMQWLAPESTKHFAGT